MAKPARKGMYTIKNKEDNRKYYILTPSIFDKRAEHATIAVVDVETKRISSTVKRHLEKVSSRPKVRYWINRQGQKELIDKMSRSRLLNLILFMQKNKVVFSNRKYKGRKTKAWLIILTNVYKEKYNANAEFKI